MSLGFIGMHGSTKLSLTSKPSIHTAFYNGRLVGSRSVFQRHTKSTRAAATPDNDKPFFALAPSAPRSPVGELAAYYLQMQPHLFEDAVDSQFKMLQEAREAQQQQQQQEDGSTTNAALSSMDLTLNKRMAEVRRAEQIIAIEDLLYICILERFQRIGVDLLPRVEPIQESATTLKALTEGVHSMEAIQLVKEHILSVLGPAAMALPDTLIKMSKLQAAQVYAASTMFGYFLRKVDSRFQLAKSLGVLPESPEDAVNRLEKLFSMADDMERSGDPDTAPNNTKEGGTSGTASSSSSSSSSLIQKPKSALRQYVETFDQTVLQEMARLVTVEGSALVERQTKALFGDVKQLQQEMQKAVGQDATSMDELMQRVQQAVGDGSVSSLTISVGTQRRLVLEAVAYGCFLRDVEGDVDGRYGGLLTPLSSMGGGDGGGDGGGGGVGAGF